METTDLDASEQNDIVSGKNIQSYSEFLGR